jgi:hypothetical protein
LATQVQPVAMTSMARRLALAVADLDGDGFLDVICCQYLGRVGQPEPAPRQGQRHLSRPSQRVDFPGVIRPAADRRSETVDFKMGSWIWSSPISRRWAPERC